MTSSCSQVSAASGFPSHSVGSLTICPTIAVRILCLLFSPTPRFAHLSLTSFLSAPTNAFIVYFTLSILASSFGGILNFLHDMLWLPVSLHSENRLQVLCFDRILELSMSWQNKKNTGETLSILDQGAAVNELFHVRYLRLPSLLFLRRLCD